MITMKNMRKTETQLAREFMNNPSHNLPTYHYRERRREREIILCATTYNLARLSPLHVDNLSGSSEDQLVDEMLLKYDEQVA